MPATPAFPPDTPRPDDDELKALTVNHLKRIEEGFRDLEIAIEVAKSNTNPIDEMIQGLGPRLKKKRADNDENGSQTYETYVATVRELLDEQALSLIPDKKIVKRNDGHFDAEDVPFPALAKIAESTEFLLKLIGSEIGYERKRELVLPLLKKAHKRRVDALRHLPRGITPRRRMFRDHSHLLYLLKKTCMSYINAKDAFSDEVTVGFFTDGSGIVHPIRVHISNDANR